MLRWRSGTDPMTGQARQLQETFHGPRKAAQQRLATLVASAQRRTGSTATLDDLLAAWLVAAHVAPATRTTYSIVLEHVPAPMRTTALADIDSPAIVALHRHLLATGVGAQTIRKIHTALSAAFRHALEWGWVQRNPCRGVRPPTITKRAYVIPTVEQLRTMQASADELGGAAGAWFRLAAATGARRSEVLALRWHDLAGDMLAVNGTKTAAAVRTVALDADTADAVRAWRLRAAERALAVGVVLDGDCFLISDDPTSRVPWRPDLATKRLARLAASAGCPGARLHDLRHAHATMLLEAGVTVRTVADRLGHTKVSTTQDLYGHLLSGADEAAAATFGDLMRG